MKWFDEDELKKIKTFIDEEKASEINSWWWVDNNFKKNVSTLVIGFLYAVKNNKCTTCIKKMKSIFKPTGKTKVLEWNDVITELWLENAEKSVESINIIFDAEIPFQVKNGDVVYELLTNPKFEKIAKAIETTHQYIISDFMPASEKEKIKKTLLSSNSYDLVVLGMQQQLWQSNNTSMPKYKKNVNSKLFLDTLDITNIEFRKKYIYEFIFPQNKMRIFESIFDVILKHYDAGTWDDNSLIDIIVKISYTNTANSSPVNFLYTLTKRGKQQLVRKIIESFGGHLFNKIIKEIANRPWRGEEKLFGDELEMDWLLDNYSDIVDGWLIIDLIGREKNEIIINKFFEYYPNYIGKFIEKYPDKTPIAIKDLFIF